jgi:hypothetical protein
MKLSGLRSIAHCTRYWVPGGWELTTHSLRFLEDVLPRVNSVNIVKVSPLDNSYVVSSVSPANTGW